MHVQADRAELERRFREQELEREIQTLKIEEQRRMRVVEEEQILRQQQMMEDVRLRGEAQFFEEQETYWAEARQEKERLQAASKLRQFEEDRNRIELALEAERMERRKEAEAAVRQRMD